MTDSFWRRTLWEGEDTPGWLPAAYTVALMAVVAALFTFAFGRIAYHWNWTGVWTYRAKFLTGWGVTIGISVASLVISTLIGVATALALRSRLLVLRTICTLYVELIRGTPLLVQIFFLYFVLAPIFELERFTAAVIALSLFEGAYASEIFRAGIVSIRRGQWEAAYSLGLSSFDTYRTIILPQALTRILPPLTGQAVSLIKDSALVSTIAVYDLTMQGRAIIAETFLTFEIWFTVAAVYLVINLSLSLLVKRLEKRFGQEVQYT